PRAAGAARPGRRPAARARRARDAGAHLRAGRRPRGGDGIPRQATAREHQQRVLPSRAGPRRAARDPAGGAVREFVNEPLFELRRAPEREQLLDGLRALDPELPLRVPVWVGADRRDGDGLVSTDPGDPQRTVAVAAAATPADVDQAVEAAVGAFPAWAARPA